VILLEVFNVVFLSTNVTIVPMIVKPHQLGVANSLGVMYSDIGFIIGQMIGAMIYGFLGLSWSLFCVTVYFTISVFIVSGLKLPAVVREFTLDRSATGVRGFVTDLTLGVRLLVRDRLLLVVFVVAIMFNFFSAPVWDVDLLYFVRGSLGYDSILYGVFSALQALGDLVAAIVVAKIYADSWAFTYIRRFPVLMAGALLVVLLAGLLHGLTPAWLVLVVAFIGGSLMAVATTIFFICRNTMVQQRVAQDAQSRVFAVNRWIGMLAFPFGCFISGLMMSSIGFVGSVTVSIVGTAVAFLLSRRLKNADRVSPHALGDLGSVEKPGGFIVDTDAK
jgi:MFS family permease